MVPKVVAYTTFTFPDLLTVPLEGLVATFFAAPYVAIVLGIPATWYTFAVAGIAGFILSFCYRTRGN